NDEATSPISLNEKAPSLERAQHIYIILRLGERISLRFQLRQTRRSRGYDLIFAGSCLSGLGIVMKKPLSIQGHVKVLSSTDYSYQKIRSVFSLQAVIHEFFQKN
ncbi:MAG TPA: hypothetical protein VLM43_04695, partial [Desulfobacterales bacterium]|nr:hypothetical protein [Desulfobacterales bacterium]